MSKGAQIVHFQFEGHPEIMQSHNWRLEMDVNLHRNRLGLPFWTKYKTLPDYEPDPNPGEDLTLATLSSNVGDLDLPTPVSKNSRKRKTKSQTSDVSSVQHVLDQFLRAGTLPESFSAGIDTTVSDGLDLGNNVEATK